MSEDSPPPDATEPVPTFEMAADIGHGVPVPADDAEAFKYDDLAEDVANELRAAEDQIRIHVCSMAESGLSIGRTLNRTKAITGHGRHTAWVTHQLGMSMRTAQRFMSIATMADEAIADGKHAKLAHLPVQLLEAMAAPSFPEEERNRLLSDLSSDAPPDKATVRARIEEAKAPRQRKPKPATPTTDIKPDRPAQPTEVAPEPVAQAVAEAPEPPVAVEPIQAETNPTPVSTGQPASLSADDIGPVLFLGSRLDQHQKAMTAASARAEA